MAELEPDSVDLSFWSPPYFVGKEYERDLDYSDWQILLKSVIELHSPALKSGGFMVVNIADIICFQDEQIPRFQARNVSRQRCPVTKSDVLAVLAKHPDWNRRQIAKELGCSEQTVQRRLEGNNIRGGKYMTQTRVNLTGKLLEEYAYDAGLFLYDRRIWAKDPAWANSRWTSNSLRAVDEFEYLYIFWKPGEMVVDRNKLEPEEWNEWGSRAIWHIPSVRQNGKHEAMFPLALADRVVRLFSSQDDLVLDPFVGSGTTAIAALQNDRRFIGLEKEQKYVELTKTAIQEWRLTQRELAVKPACFQNEQADTRLEQR